MNVKGITILKSINPITLLDTPPSKKTTLLLAMILQEPQMLTFIETMRQHTKFPEGTVLKEFVGVNFSEISLLNEVILIPIQMFSDMLCTQLGITGDFKTQIALLVFFNAFIDLDYFEGFITKPVEFVLGKANIAAATHNYSNEIGAIFIPYDTNQTQFIKWVKQNWSKIQKQMDDNLTTNPYQLGSFKNIDLSLEIIELKEKKKMSFSKIASHLYKKYPNDERVLNEEWVKKNYYSMKLLLAAPQLAKKA